MKYKSIYPWLVVDIVVFITINIILLSHLPNNLDVFRFITPLQFVVFGLAVYRAANIVSNEFVAKGLRSHFIVEKEIDGHTKEEPREKGFRGFMGFLITCPSCTGVWISLFLIYFYLFFPVPAGVVIVLLALSGMERFFAYTFGRIKNS